jgi:hypothetical protein
MTTAQRGDLMQDTWRHARTARNRALLRGLCPADHACGRRGRVRGSRLRFSGRFYCSHAMDSVRCRDGSARSDSPSSPAGCRSRSVESVGCGRDAGAGSGGRDVPSVPARSVLADLGLYRSHPGLGGGGARLPALGRRCGNRCSANTAGEELASANESGEYAASVPKRVAVISPRVVVASIAAFALSRRVDLGPGRA